MCEDTRANAKLLVSKRKKDRQKMTTRGEEVFSGFSVFFSPSAAEHLNFVYLVLTSSSLESVCLLRATELAVKSEAWSLMSSTWR